MHLLKQLSQELQALAARAAPAVVGVEHRRGQGSGFVLAPDGYILTNCHVVEGARGLRIRFANGDELKAEVIGTDERTDLAVVRVQARGLSNLALADDRDIQVGQIVMAIGNPLRFERSVSLGVVSAIDRSLPNGDGALFEGLIQTDAAINPGNSGGPLIDADAGVVGINTAIIPYAQGIGFAIPAQTAGWVSSVLIKKGEIQRPYLGISARGVDLEPADSLISGQARAVRIFHVGSYSPADKAGLRDGDLLLAANGKTITNVDDLQRVMVLGDLKEVQLEVLRAEQRHQFNVRPLTM